MIFRIIYLEYLNYWCIMEPVLKLLIHGMIFVYLCWIQGFACNYWATNKCFLNKFLPQTNQIQLPKKPTVQATNTSNIWVM